MLVRELAARLGLDIDESAFAAADAAFGSLRNGLIGVGAALAAVGAGLVGAAAKMVHDAEATDTMSAQFGISAEALQELAYQAKTNATDVGELSTGLMHLGRMAAQAAGGGGEARKAFHDAGVSIYDANGKLKPTEKLLADVADRFQALAEGQRRQLVAQELLGRSGGRLILMLSTGSDGMREAANRAHQLGVVMDKETRGKALALNSAVDDLQQMLLGMAYTLGGPLLKPLKEVGDRILEWWIANRELIATGVERWVERLGRVLSAVGAVLGFFIDNWKFFAVILASVVLAAIAVNIGAIISLIGWYAALAVQALIAWISALWPLALVAAAIAAVILIVEDLWTFLQGGDSIFGILIVKAKQFGEWLSGIFLTAVAFWRDAFTGFGNWLLGKVSGLVEWIRSAVMDSPLGSIIGAVRMAGELVGKGDSAMGAMFHGGAASPWAAAGLAATAGAPIIAAPEVRTSITVNPPAGMDPAAIASEVKDRQVDVIGTALRESHANAR